MGAKRRRRRSRGGCALNAVADGCSWPSRRWRSASRGSIDIERSDPPGLQSVLPSTVFSPIRVTRGGSRAVERRSEPRPRPRSRPPSSHHRRGHPTTLEEPVVQAVAITGCLVARHGAIRTIAGLDLLIALFVFTFHKPRTLARWPRSTPTQIEQRGSITYRWHCLPPCMNDSDDLMVPPRSG
jgi:hypothetical protein